MRSALLAFALGFLSSVLALGGDGPAVRNPSMTEGTTLPESWTELSQEEGKIAVARDSKQFKSAPASLRLHSLGGTARGQTAQILDAVEGETFTLGGSIRAEGRATAQLGVQCYSAEGKPLEFKLVGTALSGQGWRTVAASLNLPPGTRKLGLTLKLSGEGAVWLDDAFLTHGPMVADTPPSVPPSPAIPVKAAHAWTEAEGYYPEFPQAWRQKHESLVELTRHGDLDVIFLGDSLTQGWDKNLWAERFAPHRAGNFGIGGDGTPQLLWRLNHGELDGLSPRLVVLMVGINNTWPGFLPADTVRGIETVISRLVEKLPNTQILLLGILPAFEAANPLRPKLRRINSSLAKLDKGDHLRFLDLWDKFLEANGDLKREAYQEDKLHLTAAGYRLWADGMQPVFAEMVR